MGSGTVLAGSIGLEPTLFSGKSEEVRYVLTDDLNGVLWAEVCGLSGDCAGRSLPHRLRRSPLSEGAFGLWWAMNGGSGIGFGRRGGNRLSVDRAVIPSLLMDFADMSGNRINGGIECRRVSW